MGAACAWNAHATIWFVSGNPAKTKPTGSMEAPFRSIQEAADRAKEGDTVEVLPGVYREKIRLKHGGTASQPLAFRARGNVVIDGADILSAGRFVDASTPGEVDAGFRVWFWNGYKARYGLSPGGTPENEALRNGWGKLGKAGAEQVERFARADVIWLNGRLAREARTRGDLKPGSFFVVPEGTGAGLYLAMAAEERPGDHLIEASTRDVLMGGDVSYVSIKGFHFTRASNRWDEGAVTAYGNSVGWILEDNRMDWNNWGGLHVQGRGHKIRRNSCDDNGGQGISSAKPQDLLFDGNTTNRNNWKNHRWEFAAGGMKICEARNVRIRNHEAGFNIGPGIWFDLDCQNVRVEGSRVHHNTYAGIFFELCRGGASARDNFCYANDGAGIMAAESSGVEIWHNLLFANRRGVELRAMPRNVRAENISISENTLVENGVGIFAPDDLLEQRGKQNVRSGKNLFWGNIAWGTYQTRAWWDFRQYLTPPNTGLRYQDLDEVQAKLGIEADSLIKDPGIDPVSKATYEIPWP